MKNRFFVLLCFLLATFAVKAQTNATDSVGGVLPQTIKISTGTTDGVDQFWYYIQFTRSSLYFADTSSAADGIARAVVTKGSSALNNTQKWKVVAGSHC